MAQLFVDAEKIARARDLARSAAHGVQAFIGRHTTVSIERTVLRLLGISGAGSRGVPLANLMVERLQAVGALNRGAAYWYGRALHLGAKSPLEVVERLTNAPLPPQTLPSPELDAKLREEVRRETRAAVEDLRRRVRAREDL